MSGLLFAIAEPVHNHEYPLLWNLIFDRHLKGGFFSGKFNHVAQLPPPLSLAEEIFEAQRVVLIPDEFQKWFDTLPALPSHFVHLTEKIEGSVAP